MECTWRDEDCTLLQYIRMSNKDGRQRSTQHGGGRRRVAVAAQMNSRLKDSFYGQWLILNVPFRDPDDLWDDRVLRVPEGYRMLALCLLHRPGLWRRPLEVKQELQLEGHRDAHVCNILAMLEGHTAVIDAYLSGRLDLQHDPQPRLLRSTGAWVSRGSGPRTSRHRREHPGDSSFFDAEAVSTRCHGRRPASLD